MVNIDLTDNPIPGADEDQLGRADFALALSREILAADSGSGVVVGIMGPWGCGKTSILNMVAERFRGDSRTPVISFNPWLFSGTEQLVATFFEELSAQLRLKDGQLAGVADKLENYGEALSPLRFLPIAGPWLDRVGSGSAAAGRLLGRRSKARTSVGALRARIEGELRLLDQPLVVILDDIDRLSSPEIRDIFRLVRLTASFPNVIYILAFDRHRVEAALADENVDGRAYLEKILQIAYDVPRIPDATLRRLFLSGLQATVDGFSTGPVDESRWPDVFADCIWPLVNNLRDVKRYLAALPLTLRQLGDNVALVDTLAAEAVRTFLPDLHRGLDQAADALTSTRGTAFGASEPGSHRQAVADFVTLAGEHEDLARAFCRHLFPASERYLGGSTYGADWLKSWKRDRRLAHPDVLGFYLDNVMSGTLAASRIAEHALEVLSDENQLRALLGELDSDGVEGVIGELEAYEDDFRSSAAVAACRAILDQLPRLRTETRGVFDFGADLVVTRVVLRILRRVDESERLLYVRRIYEGISSLYSKYTLLTIVGHRENAGLQLVSVDEARSLEDILRAELISASAESLAQERDLLRLLWWAAHPGGEEVVDVPALADNNLRIAVLRASLSSVVSQPFGSRSVHRESRLVWDLLVEVLGGEEVVRATVDSVGVAADEDLLEAVRLARKYLNGWRPEHGA